MKTIDIFYQGERLNEIDHLEAAATDTLGAIKALLIQKHGTAPDALLFIEDGEEPLDDVLALDAIAGPTGAKLHLHRCRRVEVDVTFAGETVTHSFAPGVTVAHIKLWAAERKFCMTREEAGEHLLQISGTHERPAPGTHIGTLATCPVCRIAFDLIPDERVNGTTTYGAREAA